MNLMIQNPLSNLSIRSRNEAHHLLQAGPRIGNPTDGMIMKPENLIQLHAACILPENRMINEIYVIGFLLMLSK